MVKSQRLLLNLIRAMLVASVVAPTAVFGLFAWHSHVQIVQSAQERVQRFAAVIQEHALKVFETIALVLQSADLTLRGVSHETLGTSRELWDALSKLQQA